MARRPASAGLLAVLIAVVALATTGASMAQEEFPFDQEMLLDAKPMPGGKRVPMLTVAPDGRAQVDLWCKSGPALVTVVADTIVVMLGPMPEVPCTPERAQADADTAAALAAATNWRIEGDALVLVGPTMLRFLRSSH